MKTILTKQVLKCCELKSAGVGTWCRLAAIFNEKLNIFKQFSAVPPVTTGLFGIPELKTYKGFDILKHRCLCNAESLLEEALSLKRHRKLVEVIDELSDTLCKMADLAAFVKVAHPSSLYREAAEIASDTVTNAIEKYNTHIGLYRVLKKAVMKGDKVATNTFDDHVARLLLFDFEQSGIHLRKKERRMIVLLNDQIFKLGQQFVKRCYMPRIINKKHIPEDIQCLFPGDGARIIVSGLFLDANPVARELAYRTYYSPDKQQENLLYELLYARHRLANICGFKSFAERELGLSLLKKPSVVMDFLNSLSNQLRRYADADFLMMNKLKAHIETAASGPIAMWDVQYLSEIIKIGKFKVTDFDYTPYFSLGACVEGLSNLFHSMYRIKLVSVKTVSGETWTSNIHKLAVVHDTEGELGYIYCDFYQRQGKPIQNSQFTIRSGRSLSDGSYQQPIVVLMLNLPPPGRSQPSLVPLDMLDTLFHEMGHAMHSVLARTRYQHVSGTRCSIDLAEVPSILMEYFAADPRVLRTFARHFKTREPMPEKMLQRLCASKRLFVASKMQTQVFFAALDQIYHGPFPLSGSTSKILAETQAKYYSLPYVNNTNWQLRFSHLFGYGGKYYTYLVSRAIATKIWHMHFEADPFSGVAGERYRREWLAHGGGKPSTKLASDFLKEELTPRVLVEALIKETAASQKYK